MSFDRWDREDWQVSDLPEPAKISESEFRWEQELSGDRAAGAESPEDSVGPGETVPSVEMAKSEAELPSKGPEVSEEMSPQRGGETVRQEEDSSGASSSADGGEKKSDIELENISIKREWWEVFSGRRGYALVFVIALSVFGTVMGERVGRVSSDPHYLFLADSFLKGRWDLEEAPRHPVTDVCMTNDWAYFDEIRVVRLNGERLPSLRILRGHWAGKGGDSWYREFCSGRPPEIRGRRYFVTPKGGYWIGAGDIRGAERKYFVSFPPFPALAMVPFMKAVEWMGFDRLRFSDTTFSLFFAALAVVLLFWYLELLSASGKSGRSLRDNLLLTALFAFGSVFFFVSVQGTVWFTALVVGAAMAIAYLIALEKGRYFWAGLFLSAAFASRPLLVFLAPIAFWKILRQEGKCGNPFVGPTFRNLLLFIVPPLLSGLALLYFNYYRFGNPFEFGHAYLPAVLERVRRYGLFHYHWFPRNFYAFFLALPEIRASFPYIKINAHGMSIFITTLPLLLLFGVRRTSEYFRVLLLSAAIIALFHLFYQNTGWVTFGNRFSVDYLPLLVGMLAVSSVKLDKFFVILLIISIVINSFGAITFGRFWQFYNTAYGSLDWIYRIFKF